MANGVVPGMAEAIEQRMNELGINPTLFSELSGLTGQGLMDVRRGFRKAYQAKTTQGVARALQWPADWYQRLSAGESWRDFPDTEHRSAPLSQDQRISAVERQVRDLTVMVTQMADRLSALAEQVERQGS